MARRIAFLIGSETFAPDAGLSNLAGPRNDVAALAAVLRDPARGGFEVETFLDPPRGVVMPALDEALSIAQPDDLMLLFFAGHGKLDQGGRLCLAVADTRTNALYSTSVPAAELRNLIANSNCGKIVLLLDCCYSGAAGREFSRGSVEDQLALMREAHGLHVLTASASYETSREVEAGSGGVVMGKFSRAIADGIASGAADHDHDGLVTLSDLRFHVAQTVRGQTPRYWAQDAAGDTVIARAGPVETPTQKRLRRLGVWYAEGRVPEDLYPAIADAVEDRGPANLAALAQRLLDNLRITAEMLVGAWEGMIQQEEARQAAGAEAPRKAETTILPTSLADALQPAKLPEFSSVAARGTQATSSVQSGDVQAYIAVKALLLKKELATRRCVSSRLLFA